MRAVIREVLEQSSVTAHVAASGLEAEERLLAETISLLFVDTRTPGSSHPDLVAHGTRLRPAPLVIALAENESDPAAAHPDVFELLVKPLTEARVRRVVARSLRQHELNRELRSLRKRIRGREGYDRIVGRTAAMERVRSEIDRLAAVDAGVWFAGEAGTGKELCARTLHEASSRSERPFIAVNCAGLAQDAWMRPGGAESGASTLLEQACEGALYFDGLARLEPGNQECLVAALATPAGAAVRLFAGEGCGPTEALESGRLIDALHRRFTPNTLELPRLAERAEDIALLARHFVALIGEINQLPPIRIASDALLRLENFDWPGNVQELRNTIEHAVILATDGTIGLDELPDRVRASEAGPGSERGRRSISSRRFRDAKREVVEAFEQAYLSELLERHKGNVTSASQQAGMLRSALQRLLRKYGFKSAEFRKHRMAASSESSASSVE